MWKVKLFFLIMFVFSMQIVPQSGALTFTPDSGIRVDGCQMGGIFVSSEGKVFLYVKNGASTELYISEDGLTFVHADITKFPDLRALRISRGAYNYVKFFVELDPSGNAGLKRKVSANGFTFTKETNTLWNFPANDQKTNTYLYYTAFLNADGGICIIYLAGTLDNARSIYSPKNAPDMIFCGYHSNIFKDSTLGGKNNSYWDPYGILLPNGNLKVITMNQHGVSPSPSTRTGTIYTFTSTDNGKSWVNDGKCLRYDDFTEFDVHSLNDPKLARFPDGTFRIYVAALIYDDDGTLHYAIISATSDGTTSAETKHSSTPQGFRLYDNFPNPFGGINPDNSVTTIRYSIPPLKTLHVTSPQMVTLKVYDVLGREIATLVNERQLPGNYSVQFDASLVPGGLPSGIYFYRLYAGNFVKTKKMIMLQ